MNRDLVALTSETIKEIQKLEIVLPEIYKDVFFIKAKEANIKINDMDKEEALLYALQKIKEIEQGTKETAQDLHNNVKIARKAIQQKDDKKLSLIEENLVTLQSKVERLQLELFLDDLTAVYNRRWLYETYLQDDLFKKDGTFVFVDIDDFKNINDQHGHLVGDKVLRLLAQTFKKIRKVKTVRYAGDEFIILSESIDIAKMENLMQNVLQNLKTTGLKAKSGIFHISFSYGITEFKSGNALKDIIKIADENMYDYKKSK